MFEVSESYPIFRKPVFSTPMTCSVKTYAILCWPDGECELCAKWYVLLEERRSNSNFEQHGTTLESRLLSTIDMDAECHTWSAPGVSERRQKVCGLYRDLCLCIGGMKEHPVDIRPWRLQTQNTVMVLCFFNAITTRTLSSHSSKKRSQNHHTGEISELNTHITNESQPTTNHNVRCGQQPRSHGGGVPITTGARSPRWIRTTSRKPRRCKFWILFRHQRCHLAVIHHPAHSAQILQLPLDDISTT